MDEQVGRGWLAQSRGWGAVAKLRAKSDGQRGFSARGRGEFRASAPFVRKRITVRHKSDCRWGRARSVAVIAIAMAAIGSADGSGSRLLASEWRGVSGRVAFSDKSGDLWIWEVGSRSPFRISTSGAGTDFDPSWSPSGRQLVFRTSRVPKGVRGDSVFGIVDIATRRERLFGFPGGASFPDWSAQNRIAFTGALPFTIKSMAADGSDVRRLHARGECAEWSPNGSLIAYCVNRLSNQWDVWVMHADGHGKRRVTFSLRDERPIGWSPDGREIVVERDGPEDQPPNVVTVALKDPRPVPLAIRNRNVFPLAWLPDGRLVFVYADQRLRNGSLPQCFVGKRDGRVIQLLPPLPIRPALGPPVWFPSSV